MATAVGVWSRAMKSIVTKRHHTGMDLYPSFTCGGSEVFLDWEDGKKLFK